MSTSRKEEIIKKGFLKSLLDGTLELKDLAGINPDLQIARQAFIQGVQEATQAIMKSVESNMATSAKQDEMKITMDAVKAKTDNLDELLSLAGLKDFHEQWNGNDATKTIDLTTDYSPKSIRGRDFIVHNLGGTNITVEIDGESAKTVKKYDVFTFSGTEWYEMIITNAGNSDVEVTIVGDEL